MNMSVELALTYQRTLVYVGLDECPANALLSDYAGGLYGSACTEWRSAVVDFVRCTTRSGLLAVEWLPEIIGDLRNLIHVLEVSSPHQNLMAWSGIQFTGTQRLRDVLQKHSLLGWTHIGSELNTDFIAEIFEIFSKEI